MRDVFLKILVCLCVMISTVSCVEEFALKMNVLRFESDIVIQGRILSGDKSIIYLSRTQPFGSDAVEVDSITNAKITIVGQNGFQSDEAIYESEENCYKIDTRHLLPNTLYALRTEFDGEIYLSDYLAILDTPEIEDITYKERNDGISIHLSTSNDEDLSRYYMWNYEEDWEFHATVDFVGAKGIPVYNNKLYSQEIVNGYNPYFYCWKHTESDEICLYNTTNLDTNQVKEHELLRIPIDDVRISYIYSILVKQFCISENAYNYYRQLESLTENNSGLFAPMPTELNGNVTCVSTPSKKVRGYVLASNVKTKRLFIYESDFKQIHSEYDPECILQRPDADDNVWDYVWRQLIANQGYVAITQDGDIHGQDYLNNTLYSRECVDCRAVEGATKKRPDFWPTNHE